MAESKILHLHAGGPKTGSSAIQNFLELNEESLESAGIAYQNRVGISGEFEICSGNGFLLYRALTMRETEGALDDLLIGYFGGKTAAICSSEFFCFLNEEHWFALRQSCDRLGIHLRLIIYVRNITPFLQSCYDQVIKRHGFCDSFTKFLESTVWHHGQCLRSLDRVFPPNAIRVLHYESCRQRLLSSFIETIQWKRFFFEDKPPDQKIVNRSLTRAEREFLIQTNRKFGIKFSLLLSDGLIYTNPHAKGEPIQVTPEDFDTVEKAYGEEVEWVNNRFFHGNPVVSIGAASANTTQNGDGTLPTDQLPNLEVLVDWILKKWESIQNRYWDGVANCFLSIDWHNANHRLIPPTFDPYAYLILNRDLVEAGAAPYQHYLEYGMTEGRAWSPMPALEHHLNLRKPLAEQIATLESCIRTSDKERSKCEAHWNRSLEAAHAELQQRQQEWTEREAHWNRSFEAAHTELQQRQQEWAEREAHWNRSLEAAHAELRQKQQEWAEREAHWNRSLGAAHAESQQKQQEWLEREIHWNRSLDAVNAELQQQQQESLRKHQELSTRLEVIQAAHEQERAEWNRAVDVQWEEIQVLEGKIAELRRYKRFYKVCLQIALLTGITLCHARIGDLGLVFGMLSLAGFAYYFFQRSYNWRAYANTQLVISIIHAVELFLVEELGLLSLLLE